jgi:hypothetical protein
LARLHQRLHLHLLLVLVVVVRQLRQEASALARLHQRLPLHLLLLLQLVKQHCERLMQRQDRRLDTYSEDPVERSSSGCS